MKWVAQCYVILIKNELRPPRLLMACNLDNMTIIIMCWESRSVFFIVRCVSADSVADCQRNRIVRSGGDSLWGQRASSFYSSVLQRSTLLTQSSLFIWKLRILFLPMQPCFKSDKQNFLNYLITIETNGAFRRLIIHPPDCCRESFCVSQMDRWSTFITSQWNDVKLCSSSHWSLCV